MHTILIMGLGLFNAQNGRKEINIPILVCTYFGSAFLFSIFAIYVFSAQHLKYIRYVYITHMHMYCTNYVSVFVQSNAVCTV